VDPTRMGYFDALERSDFLLTDGAIGTCLEHETPVRLDPVIGPTGLVDDRRGRATLEALYRRYLDAGRRHGAPMQIGTPTFRAGPERLRRAGYSDPSDVHRINADCFRLLAGVREGLGDYGEKVYLAGVIGPKGDCFKHEEAPGSTPEAADYHRGQAEALAEAGVDLLVATTFPAATVVLGVARAMAVTGLPYVVSVVIRGDGSLLDGTPLADVIETIDGSVMPRPAYYAVNCVHPSVLRGALRSDGRMRRLAGGRLLGFKANASRRPPEELESLDHLESEAQERLADEIVALRDEFGPKVLGGCCGTDDRHIAALACRLTGGGR
jgi:homocysteine S-methyltransferase